MAADYAAQFPEAVAAARAMAADPKFRDPSLFAVINAAGEVIWRPLVDCREAIENGACQWVTGEHLAPLRRGQPGP